MSRVSEHTYSRYLKTKDIPVTKSNIAIPVIYPSIAFWHINRNNTN